MRSTSEVTPDFTPSTTKRRWPTLLRFAVLFGLGIALTSKDAPLVQTASAQTKKAPAAEVGQVPDFDGGVAWLNTGRPLKMADLRGKVVVLDFWTLCCINCMHIMPDLARLEKKYKNQLVVIGVHSGKVRKREK